MNDLNINSWPFVEAKRLLKQINYTTPKKGYVLFETGYGPSGLPILEHLVKLQERQ